MMNLSAFKNKIIAVAVSGGVDSVVLLHRLVSMQAEGGYSLCVVHCEHGIRGDESLADQAFVEGLCRAYGVKGYFYREDCIALAARTGESLETAARNFRYGVFERLLDEGKADYIALAHHQADQAETVLFRLCRGSALAGVGAMRAVSGRYLRPMIEDSKESILAYAAAHGLAYREDATNQECCATRNVLRLKVLPAIEEVLPAAKQNLAAFLIECS
jgi:tRNA(Ile)-lysidine synthase